VCSLPSSAISAIFLSSTYIFMSSGTFSRYDVFLYVVFLFLFYKSTINVFLSHTTAPLKMCRIKRYYFQVLTKKEGFLPVQRLLVPYNT
jgi:hypothetical protein